MLNTNQSINQSSIYNTLLIYNGLFGHDLFRVSQKHSLTVCSQICHQFILTRKGYQVSFNMKENKIKVLFKELFLLILHECHLTRMV